MFKPLLLSAGGGLLSNTQKAEAAQDSVSILIGLGGTGISCLRTVKTQVYDRIKPDDPGAITPYKTIRFIGVDTDDSGQEKTSKKEDDHAVNVDVNLDLEPSEYFSISNPAVKEAFKAKKTLEQKTETKWLRYDKISAPNFGKAGAGGIRQVGRYMMMLKASDFRNKVISEIDYARKGTDAPVYIHLFSGISGGTGAGTFLDVCYLLRSITQFGPITIMGYFFLPDVNLSEINPGDLATQYVPKNGYAAMQELDYCMRLQYNGGTFEQRYTGVTQPIKWDGQPVDMCHLICGKDSSGKQMKNAYAYAMNVTAEYVLDFLAASSGDDDTASLVAQQANVQAKVDEKNATKKYGVNVNYLSIGASCAKLPLREINTYLASVLFGEFAKMSANTPTRHEVESLLYTALAEGARSLDETYDSLYREIRDKADESYTDAPTTATEAKQEGINSTLLHYTTQTSNKQGVMLANRKSMESERNENSMINRILRKLDPILKDINRGPVYAANMFDASVSHNLSNLVDGLIEINSRRRSEEMAQRLLREKDYDNAREQFEAKNGPRNGSRFNSYLWYTVVLEQHRATVTAYNELELALKTLKAQLDNWSKYFVILSSVMVELVQTFRANYDELMTGSYLNNMKNSFSEPLIDFNDAFIKRLDREIYGDGINPGMDIGSMFGKFMTVFLANDREWIERKDTKICRLVTEYFVEDAFRNFAAHNITEYLEDRYEVYGNYEELSRRICNDWMRRLREKAKPLFYSDKGNWPDDPSRFGYISIPSVSAPIANAADLSNVQTGEAYKIRKSTMEDRIYFMVADCAFPLSAYTYLRDYEALYADGVRMYGRHYYEEKGVPDTVPFKDWRNLPSLLPQSIIDLDEVRDEIRRITVEGRNVYEKAAAYGLLDEHRNILAPEPDSLDQLRAAIEECKDCLDLKENSEVRAARAAMDKLTEAKKLRMKPTGLSLQEDGFAEEDEITHESIRDRITEDYLVSSPALGVVINESVKVTDELVNEADSVLQKAEAAIEQLEHGLDDKNNFCDALFTGVLVYRDGLTITYAWRKGGRPMEEPLCKYGKEFPFSNVPIYQAYRKYLELDQAVRDSIAADTIAKRGASREEQAAPAKMLLEEFEQMEAAWNDDAEYFQEAEEIKDFNGYVRDRLYSHCRRLRIL